MFTIGHFSRFNAARFPAKPAIVLGERVLTFGELDSLSNELGRYLQFLGVQPGDRVGILSFNTPEFAVLIQAVAKIGAILTPFNMRHTAEEVAYQLGECTPKVVIVENAASELLNAARLLAASTASVLIIEDCIVFDGGWRLIAPEVFSAAAIDLDVDGHAPAAIMYTSGSTGRPKGVMTSHENYIRIFTAVVVDFEMSENDVVHVWLPFFHNGGFASVLCPALMVGATVVCGYGPFDAARVLTDIERHQVSLTHWVATMMERVVDEAERKSYQVSSLRRVHYGAMPTPPQLLARARAIFPARFFQFYATTDAGLVACQKIERDSVSVGSRPVFNVLMRIVDDRGADVAPGEIGEIIVLSTTSGMLGYWNNPDMTARVIRGGWIYTGDMARKGENGVFTLVDRKDYLIISGGEKIAPAEVETVLGAHPAVREVAVIGIADPTFGQQVCALVSLNDGASLDIDALRAFCELRLARYKLPKKLVVVDALPRTTNGKIAKAQLASLAAK